MRQRSRAGKNDHGEVGNGTTTSSGPGQRCRAQLKVVAVCAGWRRHVCAVTSGGAHACWGYNCNGRLGNETTRRSQVPVGVVGLGPGMVAVPAGGAHS